MPSLATQAAGQHQGGSAEPWGFDNPAPIPITAIAPGTTGIDVINLGHVKLGAGQIKKRTATAARCYQSDA
jgi:hypothetical protein